MSTLSEDALRAARTGIGQEAESLHIRAKKIAEFTRAEDAAIDTSTATVRAKVAALKAKLAAIKVHFDHDRENDTLKAELVIVEADLTIMDAKAAAFEAYTQAFTTYRTSYETAMRTLSELYEAFMLNTGSDDMREATRLFNASQEQKTKVGKMGGYMAGLMRKIEDTMFDVVGSSPA